MEWWLIPLAAFSLGGVIYEIKKDVERELAEEEDEEDE